MPDIVYGTETYSIGDLVANTMYGCVHRATGSSGKEFCIKTYSNRKIKVSQGYCEVPMNEVNIAFALEHDNLLSLLDTFQDSHYAHCVFEHLSGGDLLQLVQDNPCGLEEARVRCLLLQATRGLTHLHQCDIAFQDVSLENMLLNMAGDKLKLCDPGQAVQFQRDAAGVEQPVKYRGLVGQPFRPPELYLCQPYLATQVDSWCLGWCGFCLLNGECMFWDTSPCNHDSSWQGAKACLASGSVDSLLQLHVPSGPAVDFIVSLLQLSVNSRLPLSDQHAFFEQGSLQASCSAEPKSLLSELSASQRFVYLQEGWHPRSPTEVACEAGEFCKVWLDSQTPDGWVYVEFPDAAPHKAGYLLWWCLDLDTPS